MELDNNALIAACYEVARSIRWKDNQVDEVIAKAYVELYFKVAIQHVEFLTGQGQDPNIIVRAVHYIAHTHSIPPMEGDIKGFSTMLEVLIELACPNSVFYQDYENFFKDIEEGIRIARRDYANE
ncbi:hypothetical protein [Gallionella capsiferriformans]|uniref:Uncharacterized protein n=1 Tax=Gallionella capsiferriformans (strain ES-2) TaxID=395494 RepID=D9SFE2_GALCS|nr:hypothetical protein [Gallionella capsiferriformans]ADL55239.1 hypothetical protein Galf_1211 [Gallionella capsiferriformans ES-2]